MYSGENEGIEDDLSKLRKFLRIVGVSEKDIDFSINKGTPMQRTSCIVERIVQLSSENVNHSWDQNEKIAMVSSSLGGVVRKGRLSHV